MIFLTFYILHPLEELLSWYLWRQRATWLRLASSLLLVQNDPNVNRYKFFNVWRPAQCPSMTVNNTEIPISKSFKASAGINHSGTGQLWLSSHDETAICFSRKSKNVIWCSTSLYSSELSICYLISDSLELSIVWCYFVLIGALFKAWKDVLSRELFRWWLMDLIQFGLGIIGNNRRRFLLIRKNDWSWWLLAMKRLFTCNKYLKCLLKMYVTYAE